MSKYKLILDESGIFDSLLEKYIIIGGLFFREDDEKEFEKILIPLHQHLCRVFNIDELHGAENKKLFNYVAPVIGSIDKIYPVIFVIDKYETFIFKKYNKKSFKYNKAIEHLIQEMIDDGLLNNNDELYIKIDNIDIKESETDNLYNYLPSKFTIVKNVSQEDSKNNIYIQMADLIVNMFSKKGPCKPNAMPIKMLNPKIYCFLAETINDYIKN